MADGYVELTAEKLQTSDGIAELNRMIRTLYDNVAGDTDTIRDFIGYGTPEGSITAGIGSTYRRIDGGTATTLYAKESGSGNTGWRALDTGGGGGGTPGGADTSIQFNDSGSFNGFGTWDGATFVISGDIQPVVVYFGDPSTNGSWRIRVNGSNLVQERLEAGNWVEKVAATP